MYQSIVSISIQFEYGLLGTRTRVRSTQYSSTRIHAMALTHPVRVLYGSLLDGASRFNVYYPIESYGFNVTVMHSDGVSSRFEKHVGSFTVSSFSQINCHLTRAARTPTKVGGQRRRGGIPRRLSHISGHAITFTARQVLVMSLCLTAF